MLASEYGYEFVPDDARLIHFADGETVADNVTPAERHQAAVDNVAQHRERERLVADARKTHGEYPQYGLDYWNGWKLAEVTTTTRFKGGIVPAGEFVLVNPAMLGVDGFSPALGNGRRTVQSYSASRGWHVAMPVDAIRVI